MEYLRLILGLTLPWICGFFCLRAVEARANPHSAPNVFRQIGYGLFLGYAGLHGIVLASSALFHTIQFWPIVGVLSIVTITGGLLAYRKGIPAAPHTSIRDGITGLSPAGRLLCALLLGWIVVHLCLIALEILHRPMFPWDAWLSWMYRAKAWFLQDAIFQFSSPSEWTANMAGPAYNVAGHNYPTFVPTIALWAASSLGLWSDTLVNLPVLFCGIALAMGIYGQCRELGGNYLHAVTAAYIFISIPIVGTHLALAGQADIWMAGFTGLGFAALIKGLIDDNRFQIALGMLMAVLAVAVKLEGLVWFLATITTFLLVTRLRLALGVAGLFSILALIAWILGLTYVVLPGLGEIGYADGLVHIPFKGSYPIMQFDLLDSYYLNFFSRGSWNLLWGLLLLSLPLLFMPESKKLQRPLISFYLIFAATQIILFGFTEQGRWAEDSTAINRLPIHFVPALVLCLMLPIIRLHRRCTSGIRKIRLPEKQSQGLVLPLAAFAITAAGLVAYLFFTLPPDQGEPHVFNPQDLRIVVGSGHIENGTGVITAYQNNIAIISSGTINVSADTLQSLRVETGGNNKNVAGFFWRREGDSANVDSLPLTHNGVVLLDLSSNSGWKGKVTEMGLIFYKDEDSSTKFHQLSLLPQTLWSSLSTVWRGWTQREHWTQASANWIAGGSGSPMVALPIVVLAWLLILLACCWIFVGRFPRCTPIILTCCLVAWVVLDIRWTTNSIVQAFTTIESSPQSRALSYIDIAEDQEIAAFIQSTKALIAEERAQILIYDAERELSFQMFRAKYHLLPHAAYVHKGDISSMPRKDVDYVLIMNPIFMEPGEQLPDKLVTARLLQEHLGHTFEAVIDSKVGTLFRASTDGG
jgi:hypothetical protein